MSKAIITENYLSDIGDAIRSKNSTTTKYKPSEMADAINSLSNTNNRDLIAMLDGSISSIEVPEEVTKIRSDAFRSCNVLKTVSIPNSVKTIADNAFSSTNINEIRIDQDYNGVKNAPWGSSITSVNWLRGTKYSVTVTQSDHQSLTVETDGLRHTDSFEYWKGAALSIKKKADMGYKSGKIVINGVEIDQEKMSASTNITGNMVIKVNDAVKLPDITYEGNMNVFVKDNMFIISNIASDSYTAHTSFSDRYTVNEAFEMNLYLNDDMGVSIEKLCISYKDNFYNLDTNCTYKITSIKIGNTVLSSDDLSNLLNNTTLMIGSTATDGTVIDTREKGWMQSVYKQCTGVDLQINKESIDSLLRKVDTTASSTGTGSSVTFGRLIATSIFVENARTYLNGGLFIPFTNRYYKKAEAYTGLSTDNQTKFDNNVSAFTQVYDSISENIIQNYYTNLEKIKEKHNGDAAAIAALEKYDVIKFFLSSSESRFNLINLRFDSVFSYVISIDSTDTYGFEASLTGGIAYVLYVFTACQNAILRRAFFGYEDNPIISTIPVSITFSNATVES